MSTPPEILAGEAVPLPPRPERAVPANLVRTAIGGALMGIANIIPGVSGGTMILALGLYERFVEAVADATRLRREPLSWLFLGVLAAGAVLGIALALVPITWGLHNHHHAMYGLFIGLTLGGVPIVLKEIRRFDAGVAIGAAAGVAAMVFVFVALQEHSLPVNFATYIIAGTIASAAMVLPGISGSYLLLVLGLYLPLTTAIKDFLRAGASMDFGTVAGLGVAVMLPIGIGVLLGIAGLMNLLKELLRRRHDPTMGVLLGLLVGSVIGLWPFGALVEKGEVIAEAHAMTAGNVLLVAVLLAAGFALTQLIGRIGGRKR